MSEEFVTPKRRTRRKKPTGPRKSTTTLQLKGNFADIADENPYSVLRPLFQANEDNPEPDPPEPESDDALAIDSDDSIDLNDMAPNLPPKGTLVTLLGTAMMEPEDDPTPTSVQTFRKAMSNVYGAQTCLAHHGNYAWLSEDEENYKLRIGYPFPVENEGDVVPPFVMPTFPRLMPFDETKTDYDKKDIALMQLRNDIYQTTKYWDEEGIAALKLKYPGSLTALEVYPGLLPASLTVREAIDHVLHKVTSSTAATKGFKALSRELFDLEYTPNINGPEKYFSEAMHIQEQIRQLQGPKIDDAMIMDYAIDAFLNSGHTQPFVATIVSRWKLKNTTSFAAFRTFFNKELGDLYENGDRGTQEQANQAAEVNDELRELREQQANFTNVIDSMKAKYDAALLTKSAAGGSDDTSTNTKTTKVSELTTDSLQNFLKLGIAEAVKESEKERSAGRGGGGGRGRGSGGGRGNTSNRGTNSGTGMWRQYDKYCFTRGVNPNCNGSDCQRYKCIKFKTDNAPPHDATATFNDRKGGSDRLEGRWMRWLNPDNQYCLEKFGEPVVEE